MFQATESDHNPLGFARAAAGEKNVERVIPLQTCQPHRRLTWRNLCNLPRGQQKRRARRSQYFLYAPPGQRGIQRHVGTAGFYCAQKCDKHFRLAMSQHSDGTAICSQPLIEITGQRI